METSNQSNQAPDDRVVPDSTVDPPALPALRLLPWAKVTSFQYRGAHGRIAWLELSCELRSPLGAASMLELRARRGGS